MSLAKIYSQYSNREIIKQFMESNSKKKILNHENSNISYKKN